MCHLFFRFCMGNFFSRKILQVGRQRKQNSFSLRFSKSAYHKAELNYYRTFSTLLMEVVRRTINSEQYFNTFV